MAFTSFYCGKYNRPKSPCYCLRFFGGNCVWTSLWFVFVACSILGSLVIASMMLSYCSVTSGVCGYSALLCLLGKTVSSSVSMSASCGGRWRVVRVAPVTMSGEYPAVVSGASFGNLEYPGPSVYCDWYWWPNPRELTVVDSLAQLRYIKRFIIPVRAENCTCRGSRLAFILSSTNSGENLMLFSLLLSFILVSTSPVFSSPCVEILGCDLKSFEFPLPNVLNL